MLSPDTAVELQTREISGDICVFNLRLRIWIIINQDLFDCSIVSRSVDRSGN